MNELIILAMANIDNEEDQIFMTEIYDNYYSLMYKRALEYVRNEYDAEDIAHELYINIMKNISTLKGLECCTLVAYIVYSVKNTSLNFIKSRNKNSEDVFLYGDDDLLKDIRGDTDTPEEIFIYKYDAEALHEAIKRLNPKYALVLECKYFERLSDNDIAKILSIKPDSVREYLTRARKALRKILEKEPEFHEIR